MELDARSSKLIHMEFAWTDEQRSLRSSVRRMLEARASLRSARDLAESGTRHDPKLWRDLARQAGLQSLAIPEVFGGAGASPVELAIVAEETGRVLLGGPFLSTAVLGVQTILAADDDAYAHEVLPAVAEGELTLALAVVEADGRFDNRALNTAVSATADARGRISGAKALVLDGAEADVLIVAAREADGLSLFAVQSDEGVRRSPLAVLDQTRAIAALEFDGAPGRRIGAAGAGASAIEKMLINSSIYLAAEQLGASERATEITAEYARTRRQFGREIGAFQAVKHRLADMAVRVELARSAVYWAAWQQPGSEAAAMGASVAAAYCGPAFLQTAKDMIQLHGGIGFTWEHDAHLFLRRARATQALLGDPAAHRARLEPFLLQEVSA
ncbi:alkylation response protein AidB-like acyl-CoA dehydrogenase [Jatrophihabitans sp. GAS493]|uniref:acyl-CoA dehydrogenase family protein n=1 Tax=Jatrophihabitans sp. GAS493 TaxID=1907575 RepID=UPI000BC0D715|nr:acyl-CoA dehydrogenase family protein [Jatrophihabitans sp. GAS493]SOD74620.1 alkylation response protein AidB-like acyl-CoA dehydrogenase [Jatrophihabitans sp. GAS493]